VKSFEESVLEFERGDFRSALDGFIGLSASQPGNGLADYYAGRCHLELNEDPELAIERFRAALGKGVTEDVTFHLGRAYQRNYQFTEAIRSYSQYEIGASRQEIRESGVKQLMLTCRSAQGITATYNQYEVMAVTFIDLSDSAEFCQVRMKGGQLQRKPPEFFGSQEDRTGLNSLVFLPQNPVRGESLFFSGQDRSAEGGYQLFRVRKLSGKEWGEPEEIKSLNTEGDELLPYFDPNEGDLYFASDGREGVGGFDLYRTHYDRERDAWTDILNVGFPVNSVMDEYLLLPGTDLGMMTFLSNRQGTDSTLTVYRVHLVEPKKKTDPANPGMLKEIASLGGAAEEVLAEIYRVPVPATPEKPPVVRFPYQETLAEALMHQAASDSLKDLATAARAMIRESADPNDRWVWQKQIMVWEKKAHDEEAIADLLYAQVEQERTDGTSGAAVNAPEAIDTRSGGSLAPVVAVSTVEGEPGSLPEPPPADAGSKPVPVNRFDILAVSPYTDQNPIPIDLPIPMGVFYRIQLGAFGSAVEPDAFGGISPITAETLPDRGIIKYYAGKFSNYADASSALERTRSAGYEDAFIVAWYNGSTISTQKAKQLE
jgi:tetratricopeptide (TPR) repeat protein